MALLNAFPSRQSLAQMVRIKLNENLEAIAGGMNLSDVVFSLIEWTEAQDRIQELATKAHEYNPGNQLLKEFVNQLSQREDKVDIITKPTIFISYSQEDEAEKNVLLTHLDVLQQVGLVNTWSDDQIGPGAD